MMRTAADSVGLPDGPMGDLSKLQGDSADERMARNLATCLLTFAGRNQWEIDIWMPLGRKFSELLAQQKPPVQLLLQMLEYATDMHSGQEIDDDRVENLQIHIDNWRSLPTNLKSDI